MLANSLFLGETNTLTDKHGRDVVLAHREYGPFEGHPVRTPFAEVEHIEAVSSPPSQGYYWNNPASEPDRRFRLSVRFSRSVSAGSLQAGVFLRLEVGDRVREAQAFGRSSDGRTLLFDYLVADDDEDTDGISVPANAFALREPAKLEDIHSRPAVLTHRAYGPFEGQYVKTLPAPPGVEKIEIVSEPGSDGYYAAESDAAEVRALVTFARAVTASAAGVSLKLRVGEALRTAVLDGAATGKALEFVYAVGADADADGIEVPANALTVAQDATLLDAYDRPAVQTHVAYGPFRDHRVRRPPAPEILGIEAVSPPQHGFYFTGDTITVRATFSAPVIDTRPPSGATSTALTLSVGDARVEAEILKTPPEGTATPEFVYTVTADGFDADGVSVPAGSLTLVPGATLEGPYGQDATLTHGPYGPFASHAVNTLPPAPEILGIEMASAVPERGYYIAGETIAVRATFSAPVTETRSPGGATGPTLTLLMGETRVQAQMQGTALEDAETAEFVYEVTADGFDADGVSVPAGVLTLAEDARLEGPYGQAAVLRHGAYGPFAGHTVNTLPPPPHIVTHRGRLAGARCAGSTRPGTGSRSHRIRRDVQRAGEDHYVPETSGPDSQVCSLVGVDRADAPVQIRGDGTSKLHYSLLTRVLAERRGPGWRERAGRQPWC